MRSRPSPPSHWNSATGQPKPNGFSPASLAVCALATLVALPVILATRSDGASEVTIEAAAPATSETLVAVTDIEVGVSRLFEAGADETEMSSLGLLETSESTIALGARQLVANTTPASSETTVSPSSSSTTVKLAISDATKKSTAPASTDAPTSTAAPTTAPPSTRPPATDPPATDPPATDPPATDPPATDPPAPEAEASGTPTAEQWANLRQCESGGNYSIVSSNGLYHGAYQFGTATWNSVASSAGRSDLVGVAPSAAAPGDQDAMAVALWNQSGAQPWPHCGKYLS